MLDAGLRGGALGIMLLTGVLLLWRHRNRGALSIAVLGLLIGCYLIVSAPNSSALPALLRSVLILGATLAPAGLTWMMMEILTDRPDQRRPWLLLGLLAAATAALPQFGAAAQTVRAVTVIGLYLGLMGLAIRSGHGDLVASRRRFRRVVLAVMGLLGVIISVVEALGLDRDLPAWIFPLQATAILLLAAGFALWALQPAGDLFLPDAPTAAPRPAAPQALVARLQAAMASGIWRREGLTIGALADELGVPEHRLRSAINQALGYRNFATFINGHRIEAAKAILRDPDREGTTILEIAYDSGFASLGPFNKAFRAMTGQSPREYRAAALAASVTSEPS